MTNADNLTWNAPGPGHWELLADHYPRPITAALASFAEVWSEATTTWMHGIGLPVERATMAVVNGMPYVNIAAGGGSKSPPPWLMNVIARVTPSLRRAEKHLQRVLADRPWQSAIASWYEHEREAAIERMLGLTRESLPTMSDLDLADHVERCFAEVIRSAREHLAMHAYDSLPPGLFVVDCIDWGLGLDEAVALLTGSSPASRAASAELTALQSAVNGRAATSLSDLRALGPEVARALDKYLEYHGNRLLDGYDIDCATIAEQPEVIVRIACSTPVRDDGAAHSQRVDLARRRIPTSGRGDFDRGLIDARAAYGIRDDNSGILICWPTGLLRRAILEAGRRLAERNDLDDQLLALEATVEEIAAATRGAPLDSHELASRAKYRASMRASDAPNYLGDPPAPMPAGIPGALGKVFRVFAIFDFGAPAVGAVREGGDESRLTGVGIGTANYTGRARIVPGGAIGLTTFEPGDVLVAPMTSPSYSPLLSLAGALVTEAGGRMSHAAIMARELDLPAVLGVDDALARINDGDELTVDAVAGTVTVRATSSKRAVAT